MIDYAEANRKQMKDIAYDLGKDVEDLEPWVDYDPITVDEIAWQLHRGRTGVRWTGD